MPLNYIFPTKSIPHTKAGPSSLKSRTKETDLKPKPKPAAHVQLPYLGL